MNFKQKTDLMKKIVNDNSIPYTSLHVHSYYSILDGMSSPKQIVQAAVSMGHGAAVITDHASVSALPELFKECKTVGIKPIIGCEFYIVDSLDRIKQKRNHLTVLAKSWSGVQSIFRQLTLANKQIHHRPRLDYAQALDFKDCIVMTACSSGPLSNDGYEEIHKSLMGKYGDDYFLEVMPHDYEEQKIVNDRALELAARDGVKVVATNDSHYISLEDRVTHEILLAIQTRAKWSNPKRFGKEWPDVDFKSRHDMVLAFEKFGYNREDIEIWLNNTLTVSKLVDIVAPVFEMWLPSPLDN